jgi:very-short-patch-repair endonuclease
MYRRGSEAEATEVPGGPRRFAEVLISTLNLTAHAVVMRADCESPIEVMLGSQLQADLPAQWALVPQYKLRGFRFDFAVFPAGESQTPKLLIECDGRQFHNSPEQIQRDARKTELCCELRIPLLRFTGREIYRDQRFCSAQCLACLEGE